MNQDQGCNSMEDTTPPMGAMPVQLLQHASDSEQHADDGVPAAEFRDAYYLVSKQDCNRTEIANFPFVIGRLSTCDLRISNKKVSREHALIIKANNALVITNENSLNGTLVNKHKIKRVVLQDGDEISIANEIFVFEVQRVAVQEEKPLVQEFDKSDDYNDEQALTTDIDSEAEQSEVTTEMQAPGGKRMIKRRRLIGFAAIMLVVAFSALFAYQNYQQQSKESRVFVVSEQETKVEALKPDAVKTVDAANESNVTQTEQSAVSQKSLNPQASQHRTGMIKMATAEAEANHSAPASEQKQAARIYKEKKTTPINKLNKQKRLVFEHRNSQEKIHKAINYYHEGDFLHSRKALNKIANNKRHQSEYRVQAKKLQANISELNNYYESGNKAFANNNKEEAFVYWEQLLNKHNRYFPTRQSHYTNEIKDKVAVEYEQRGNDAYVNEQWSTAYQNWKNALAIRPREETQQSVNLMDAEIRELYRTGYRYETVNISRALEYWEALLQKAPRDHEYYIKAAAKMQWYRNRR